MNGKELERDVAKWLQSNGYQVELTSGSGDRGVDVWAQKNGNRVAVQAKSYSSENKVTSPEVQKVSGLLTRPDVDIALLVTTSLFTSEAHKVADNRGVQLLSVAPSGSGRTSARNQQSQSGVGGTARKISSDEDYSTDPRIQSHQERAGISSAANRDTDENNSNQQVSSRKCPKCGETISNTVADHVEHWEECALPENRPSDLPVDVWWNIKDRVSE